MGSPEEVKLGPWPRGWARLPGLSTLGAPEDRLGALTQSWALLKSSAGDSNTQPGSRLPELLGGKGEKNSSAEGPACANARGGGAKRRLDSLKRPEHTGPQSRVTRSRSFQRGLMRTAGAETVWEADATEEQR